jgi:hypothetical protein
MPTTRRILTLALASLVVLAFAPTGQAARHRPLTLRMPKMEVPPGMDREVCTFVRLPKKKAMQLGGELIVNIGNRPGFTSHHFLIWAYTGTHPDEFPTQGQIQDGEACLDFGPSDREQRVLIAGSQSPRLLQKLPRGVAQDLPLIKDASGREIVGIIMNTHWINSTDQTQRASVKVKLLPARGKVKRLIKPIFEVTANAFIKVPPGTEKAVSTVDPTGGALAAWRPGNQGFNAGALAGGSVPEGDACVVMLTAHMHKRGKLFTIDLKHADGSGERIFETTSYSDPGQKVFNGQGPNPPPMLVKVGEALRYDCMHDNGMTDPSEVKLGCEEEAGVTPGKSIFDLIAGGGGLRLSGAAKRCHADADCTPTDPAYPGRTFTGRCVPANLVFGFTSDDDMCILPGAYYDADPAAAPGHECDL